MNALQKWRLERFCREHEIDTHEIDDELSYSENMNHLNTLVPEFMNVDDRMGDWYAALEQHLDLHLLEEIIMALRLGKGPKPEDYGQLPDPERFSLREWVENARSRSP